MILWTQCPVKISKDPYPNPINTQCIHMVKVVIFFDLEQN
jgi:hypothetical protein